MRILHDQCSQDAIQLPHELSSAKLVEDAAQRPHISGLAIPRRGKHLRCHVAISACMCQSGIAQASRRVPAKTKVPEAYVTFLGEEDILRLQVSVDHIFAMQILDGLKQLSKDCPHPVLGETQEVLFDLFLEIPLGTELHDDDEVRLGLKASILHVDKVFLIGDDVTMSQHDQLLGFSAVLVHFRDLSDRDLLRDEAIQVGHPFHQVHRAVATAAQQIEAAIAVAAQLTGAASPCANLPEVDGTEDIQGGNDRECSDVVAREVQNDLGGLFHLLGLPKAAELHGAAWNADQIRKISFTDTLPLGIHRSRSGRHRWSWTRRTHELLEGGVHLQRNLSGAWRH
mmetsp:Transcript_28584/g.62192  ORF Transcript_28584/g.62192 Transcript_28584/m.62192 type:complete len:341 (+) Transcript_28584:566-1588(+)